VSFRSRKLGIGILSRQLNKFINGRELWLFQEAYFQECALMCHPLHCHGAPTKLLKLFLLKTNLEMNEKNENNLFIVNLLAYSVNDSI
jgi:hypothetical protein